MIYFGIPWSFNTSLKKRQPHDLLQLVLLHGTKCAIFENMTTITKMEFEFLFVIMRSKVKYILSSSQIVFGIGKGRYNPLVCFYPLAHFGYFLTNLMTSLLIVAKRTYLVAERLFLSFYNDLQVH